MKWKYWPKGPVAECLRGLPLGELLCQVDGLPWLFYDDPAWMTFIGVLYGWTGKGVLSVEAGGGALSLSLAQILLFVSAPPRFSADGTQNVLHL